MIMTIPPFSANLIKDASDMLSYDFMRYAIGAGTCIALAAGLVGYFVVTRNQVFTSDALSHVAFTGGMGGLLFGLPLVASVFAATVAGALGVGALGGRARGRDVAIGTVFAWVLGIGALCLSLYTTTRSGSGGIVGVTVLFGSILSLQASQAGLAIVGGLAVSLVIAVICRPLLFASLDPDVAATRGVPTRAMAALFLVVLGVTVAEAVQAVGALLIFGLLVTPAAVAQNLTARPYRGLALSAALALLFVWVGLAMAFYIPYPASFFITAVAFLSYLGSIALPQARTGTNRLEFICHMARTLTQGQCQGRRQ
jgi:zinc/manganese transport system permease protein